MTHFENCFINVNKQKITDSQAMLDWLLNQVNKQKIKSLSFLMHPFGSDKTQEKLGYTDNLFYRY